MERLTPAEREAWDKAYQDEYKALAQIKDARSVVALAVSTLYGRLSSLCSFGRTIMLAGY